MASHDSGQPVDLQPAGTRRAQKPGCMTGRCWSNGGERPTSLILSQQDGEVGGEPDPVVLGGEAALTKPGRTSTPDGAGPARRERSTR